MSEAHDAQQLALDAVLAHADAAWIRRALDVVEGLARTQDTFTSDDIWRLVIFQPHEPRALGAILREAHRRGWCEATDRTRPSRRVACNARPIRVWRSLVRGLGLGTG